MTSYIEVFLLYTVISNSGRSVGDVNDAAAAKALFFHSMLHNSVIRVGVDAKIGAQPFAECYAGFQDPAASVGSDAVNGAVCFL